MNKDYPLEALLRPPVELWSVVSAVGAGFIALVSPWAMMMTPSVGYATAAMLFSFAFIRGKQAAYIIRYQKNIRQLPLYTLSAVEIPVSQYRLFLGRGFLWQQQHTQRLRDTMSPKVRKYVEQSPSYQTARRLEIQWETHKSHAFMVKMLRSNAWWNPVSPLPAVGGKPQIHAVGSLKEMDVTMDLKERVGHTLVLGTTRVGKTRLAEIFITQDIARGDVVIVFDPKGDAALMKRVVAEARRAGREDELYVFHLGYPDISCRYNAIGNFSRITEIATRVTNTLPNEGNSAAFREFAWRFTNMISMALVKMGKRPDYQLITRYITNIEPLLVEYYQQWLPEVAPEGWEQEVNRIKNSINERDLPYGQKGRSHDVIALVRYAKEQGLYEPVANGLRSAFEYDKTYFDKIVASLLPLMEKLISGKISELISPDYSDIDDSRPIIDWRQIIRRKGIVFIGLDAPSDMAVAAAVGNSMFADLISVSGEIYKHGTDYGMPDSYKTSEMPIISLHADEFNELIGDEFIPLLNKAGGSGFQVTAYTQTWSDVEARLGNKAKAGQVAGNFNTMIMLRVKELATAEMLTNQLDICEVSTTMLVSGVNDDSDPRSSVDFTSKTENRISVTETPLVAPATIMALPKGQAFALLEGGNLWKVRMALPTDIDDDKMPQSLNEIADDMKRRYVTNDHWWVA